MSNMSTILAFFLKERKYAYKIIIICVRAQPLNLVIGVHKNL